MAVSEHLIDKRVVERSLSKNKLDRAEYDAYLEALPDLSHNIARMESQPAPRSRSAAPSVQPVSQSAASPAPAGQAVHQSRPLPPPPPPAGLQPPREAVPVPVAAPADPPRDPLPSRPPSSDFLGS
jgi:hypothetical protein